MYKPLTLIGRTADLEYVRRHALDGDCISLVGVSNLGKSALLRQLCNPTISTAGTFVYVDCNQMGERTSSAFFTATWFAIATAIRARQFADQIKSRVTALYDELVHVENAKFVALHFDEGFGFALDNLPHPLILCFDEFDEVYFHLEPQVFLNLRSLKDRYGDAIAYVTATEREITRFPASREQGEFLELIAPHVHYMHFMEPADTCAFCLQYATREHVTFSDADLAFIRDNADGHPGLAQAVCIALGAVTGTPTRDAPQDRVIHQLVQQNLATDSTVRAECEKIWDDLESDERDALLHLNRSEDDSMALKSCRAKFIVRDSDDGPIIFSRLFADFVRRQHFKSHPQTHGVYIDVDASVVFVDGKPIETLTDLEYRLLMFLYGRIDRLCDKYAIVEAVWGEDYIDKVDDARIEKLVSRLRQKIEPDATKPRYLVSMRGRGYKLVR